MKNKIIIALVSIATVFSCAQNEEKQLSEEAIESLDLAKPEAEAQLAEVPQNDLYSNGKTKLIKTVNYRFEVDNVKKSTEAIEAALKKYPAYISSSKLHLENPILENKITIRIQNEYFHNLLKEIDLQARFVNFRDVTTDDVSKDFVDLESRVKTKREVEARYMEILRKKAGTIEELLDAERQIGSLHEEIEATISRINYLKDQVSYSTINLEFYQTITQELKASDEITLKDKFSDALTTGWQGIVIIALALTYIWPLILLGAGVFMFIKLRNTRIASSKSM